MPPRVVRSPPSETRSRRSETPTSVTSTSSPRSGTPRLRRILSRIARRPRRGRTVSCVASHPSFPDNSRRPRSLARSTLPNLFCIYLPPYRAQRPEQDSDGGVREGEEGASPSRCSRTSGSCRSCGSRACERDQGFGKNREGAGEESEGTS